MFLAALFVLLGVAILHLVAPWAALTPRHLLALIGGWLAIWGAGYTLLRVRLPSADLLIVAPVALLSGWGLLMIARVAPNFLLRQIFWLFAGVGGMCGVALIPSLPRLLRRYRYTLLVAGLLLLAATLVFGVNPSGFGARLWLGLPGFYFQPSELLKLLLVIYLAAYLSDHRGLLRETRPRLWPAVLGPMLSMVGLALILLGWQDDLGGALLYYLTFLALLYLAWGRPLYVLGGLLLFGPIFVAGTLLSARVALRVSIWLNPWAPEQADRAFQILQSLFAQAAGGLLGQGPGLGRPTLIPAVHTDFVYAAVVEEFGIVGALALLGLLAFLVQRGLRLALRTSSPFESLLAAGIAALLALQTWVIVGGNVKLIPITGVTLPLLSYGGSSLVTTLLAIGLLLNLSAPHPPPLDLALPAAGRMPPPLRRTIHRLSTVLFGLLALAGLATAGWSVLRADELRAYPTNSQRILDELQIRRGRIVDRRNTLLAGIEVSDQGYVERTYPVPEAAPVVGYATLNYGTSGIEGRCDPALRGDVGRTAWDAARDRLLHRPQEGRPVQLTLDARLQQQAQALLSGYRGAAVLVDTRTGEILALASAPTYDPALVDSEWESLRANPDAPLLNRATQGLAQPGTALQTIILGELLAMGTLSAPPVPLDLSVNLNGSALGCLEEPEGVSWKAALTAACPAPFATAGETLGPARLAQAFERWGLTTAPALEIGTAGSEGPGGTETALEAIGQGELLVTPLQMVSVAATLGNRGVRPLLYLLASEQEGCPLPAGDTGIRVLEAETAATLLEHWSSHGSSVGHLGHALGGPERPLSWFLGLNSSQVPRYAVAILLENTDHPAAAAEIGNRLLQHAVAP